MAPHPNLSPQAGRGEKDEEHLLLAPPPSSEGGGRDCRARIVLTCMDALMPRAQGKDCSDVHGCTNAAGAGMRKERPAILLHSRHPWRSDVQVPRSTGMCESGHPWRSDVREWPSMAVRCQSQEQRTTPGMEEVEPRREQRSREHDYTARIVPTILLHSRHPWRSDVGGTSPGQGLF